MCTRLLYLVVTTLPSDPAKQCLEFIIFPNPSLPRSGQAVVLPIDASSITICQLMEKHLLDLRVLLFLVEKGLPVTHQDVSRAAELIPDRQVDLFMELVKQLRRRGGRALNTNGLLETSINLMKSSFASFLVTNGGCTPSTTAVLKVASFPTPAPELLRAMARTSAPTTRAKLAVRGFVANRGDLVSIAFESGPIDGKAIDLGVIMNSLVLCANTDYVKQLLDAGAKPVTGEDNTTPIYAALHSTVLSRVQQVDIVCTLIEGGASVSHLCGVFPEGPTSPVHAATKLMISTGMLFIECHSYHSTKIDNLRMLSRNGCHFSFQPGHLVTSYQSCSYYLINLNCTKFTHPLPPPLFLSPRQRQGA